MAANNTMNCTEVDNLDIATRKYEEMGCTVRRLARERCAVLSCPESNLFICERGNTSISDPAPQHDELDEAADTLWGEEPL